MSAAHGSERMLKAAHRGRLVGQRTALINDLRWHLHDIDPEFEVPARRFTQRNWQARAADKLTALPARAQVRVALDELARIRELTTAIASLENEVHQLVRALLDRREVARITGTAPIPASSGNRVRHRLDPGGNRQLQPRKRSGARSNER